MDCSPSCPVRFCCSARRPLGVVRWVGLSGRVASERLESVLYGSSGSAQKEQVLAEMTMATLGVRRTVAGLDEQLVKSRQRVADHGEVFTPRWLVDEMLDLVKSETDRIDSRFLEPACGSGNFLLPVLERKLATVRARHGRSDFEKRHYALFALMCVYGIELLPDNVAECRENLAAALGRFLGPSAGNEWHRAAAAVLAVNIVQGDALKMTDASGEAIIFPEWGYLGRGRYQRRDFRFDDLTQRASASVGLFEAFEEHEIFTPVRTYARMTVQEIAE